MGVLKTVMRGTHHSMGESLATMVHGRSLFNNLHSDSFASVYPSIRAISNEYMTVQPFAIDGNGKKVENHDIINALYHPNQEDSSVSFFEKIAVSTLSLKKTYILVWRRDGQEAKPGGDFTTNKIAGFTFLEFPAVSRRDGRTFYGIGSQEFNDKEVIVLPGGVDPHDLYGGYSPSEASRRWATLDDYIGDFQAGFFENGAVPAGQFQITAPSVTEYNDIVDMLQARHRGAGKNGNVTYSHRPIDPATGKAANGQIEWIPFSQSNKDIDFKNLFEQVNHRLDVAYGVPGIVKGIDDAATYANAQVADKTFSKRAVYPLLLRNYTQFTHELNRITNGTGIAITFEYEIPTVADEEKVEAETKNIHSTIIRDMVAAGYSLDSIVDAFKLSNAYKNLKTDNSKPKIDNDKPDVDEGGEVNSSPDPEKIDGVTPTNKAHSHGGSKGTDLKPKNLSESDIVNYELQMREPTRRLMEKQVERAVSALDPTDSEDATDEEKETFVDEMMVIVSTVLLYGGIQQWDKGRMLLIEAGLEAPSGQYELSEETIERYKEYLGTVADSYTDDTAASIRNVLQQANSNSWTKFQTQSALRNIMQTDEWRITRLSTSEINRSGALSSVESMVKIQDETEATIEKSMLTTGGNPCEFCRSRVGQWYKVGEVMVAKGETVVGEDGGMMVNNWDDNTGHDIHANGQCVPQYRVVRD